MKSSYINSSESGFGIVAALGATAVVGLLGVAILYSARNIISRNVVEHSQIEAQYANDRALTLAGYLISNNFILCREPQTGSTGRCEWGGNLQKPLEYQAIEFKLEDTSTDEKGSFRATAVMDVYNAGFEVINRKIKTSLTFTLANFGKDLSTNSQSANLIGKIPGYAAAYDDDWWMVLVEAKTSYLDYDSGVDSGDGAGKIKYLTSVGGIRRPLASPVLQVSGSPMCSFSCTTGQTLGIRPDCRGPQIVLPEDKEVKLALTLLNLGPGALYRADYDKTVVYSSNFYPSKANAPIRSVMSAVAATEDPIMPLQKKVNIYDTFECASPEVFQADQTELVDNQRFMSLFTYRYDITVSRFDLNQNAFRVASTRKAFIQNFDAFNPSTFQPTQSNSALEPRKAGGPLAPLDSNLFRLPSIADPVPIPDPVVGAVGGGDGDGGGGGN